MIIAADLLAFRDLLRPMAESHGTVFCVIAVDRDTGARMWCATAGGPWNRELRHVADEYERMCPEDCAHEDWPLDLALPSTN